MDNRVKLIKKYKNQMDLETWMALAVIKEGPFLTTPRVRYMNNWYFEMSFPEFINEN